MTDINTSQTPQRTPLYNKHLESDGKMVDFAGWEMPINYGSQVQEHHQVRKDAGMFDVSHMVVLDLTGNKTKQFLQYLLANDVAKLKESGKALYSGMLNQKGGVIDDLIVYYLDDNFYRMVVNAATRDKDIQWINQQAESFDIQIKERIDLSMIAVQGPTAREKVHSSLNQEVAKTVSGLNVFFGVQIDDVFFARTGYTGEDGYEIIIPNNQVCDYWDKFLSNDIKPIGLGARDTLRLEAGMNLYGTDMDESISPLAAGMAWTIAWEPKDRNFIGRSALEQEKADGPTLKLVGLILEDKGVLRGHQKVITEFGEGEITSGTYSPTLGYSIALARVPSQAKDKCHVEIRDKQLAAKIVKPQFVRHGESVL